TKEIFLFLSLCLSSRFLPMLFPAAQSSHASMSIAKQNQRLGLARPAVTSSAAHQLSPRSAAPARAETRQNSPKTGRETRSVTNEWRGRHQFVDQIARERTCCPAFTYARSTSAISLIIPKGYGREC